MANEGGPRPTLAGRLMQANRNVGNQSLMNLERWAHTKANTACPRLTLT